jgi:Zn-dependent peptidase ImmA (M78 family)
LWLGTTGVSGGNTDTQIESYCNRVAGEMLLPEAEMAGLRILRRASLDETVGAIAQFATSRKISRALVAYKILRVDIITQARWRELDKHYADEWNAAQEQPASKERKMAAQATTLSSDIGYGMRYWI